MLISHKHKFIFVKTKKVAGSSLEKILYNYLGPDDMCAGSLRDNTPRVNLNCNGHISARKIRKLYPDEWNSYYKFTIERNPWDFFVSKFYWYSITKKRRAKRGFESYLKNPKNLETNWKILSNKNNEPIVDKIFKYETLHEELSNQDLIPYNSELQEIKLKSSLRQDSIYRDMYNEETAEIVRKKCRPVIDYFGYKF